MYLTNKFGRVVEHDDPAKIKKLMDAGLRESTQDEIDAMLAKHAQRAAEAAMAKGDGIFYQTVSASPDGYGMSRDLLKKEIFRQGVYLSENYGGQKIGLLYSYPYGVPAMRTAVRIVFTMFESDKIPEDWPDYLKAADQVLVPSEWCQEVFKKSGIESTVVHLGYNDEQFYYIDRPVPVENGEPFTFIHYDSFNVRKGFMEVVSAFSQEFKENEPVRLILKTVHQKSPIPIMKSEYPNIEVIRDRLDEKGLRELLGRANCMVYPSRGEGFGITPLEAMATGIPAIVPNAHGISAYFNSDYMLEVEATEKTPALYNRFRGQDVGSMVAPSVKDLRKKMRYAYNHQAEMKELGKKASKYVEQFTYKRTAKQLVEILKSWEDRPIQARADSKFLNVEEV